MGGVAPGSVASGTRGGLLGLVVYSWRWAPLYSSGRKAQQMALASLWFVGRLAARQGALEIQEAPVIMGCSAGAEGCPPGCSAVRWMALGLSAGWRVQCSRLAKAISLEVGVVMT